MLLSLLTLGIEFLLLLELLRNTRLPQALALGALVGLHVDGRLERGVRPVTGHHLRQRAEDAG